MGKGDKSLMRGTWVLTLTSLFVKILSAIYRVPFQNLVGDEGFYIYQQVYPLYGVAMTFSLAGLPVFLSKLVAEADTLTAKRKVVSELFPFVFWLSLLLFALLFGGQTQIAIWMGDVQLAPLIGVVAFTFLLTPFLTSYRGFYQGLELMEPTAYSQLWEQVLRVVVILVAASLFTFLDWSLYDVGTWAMTGALVGGLVALLVLSRYQRKMTSPLFNKGQWRELFKWPRQTKYLRRLLLEGGLICGYSALLILFQLVDSFVVKNMLVASGMGETLAKVTKGAYDRGQPLLQVGMVIGVALTTAFLPSLRRYFLAGSHKLYLSRVKLFIRLAATLGTAASLGLVCLLPALNISLFNDNQGQVALQLLMLTVALMTLILVFQIIYQSQNSSRWPVMALCAGLLTKIIVSPLLTKSFGIIGASLSTLSGLLICLLVLVAFSGILKESTKETWRFVWRLALALSFMVVSLILYQTLLGIWLTASSSRIWYLLSAIGGAALGGGVLIYALFKLKVFTTREWLFIPFGKRLLRIK